MLGLQGARTRTSVYNRLADQRPRDARAVQVVDVTLRDGEQAVDVAFNDKEKVDILWALSDTGVQRAQIGFTGRDESVAAAAKSAGVPIAVELMTVLSGKDWRTELRRARDLGVDSANLLIRASDDMIGLLGLDRPTVSALVEEATHLAKDLGFPRVVFGPSFATQADPEFLFSLYRIAGEAGANELAISDTLAVATPQAIAYLVERIASVSPASIRLHCHNDFGLSNACALAGVLAGADVVDTAVNGLGERAGNVALEEFVTAAEVLYGLSTGIDTTQLSLLSELVSTVSRTNLASNKAVVGRNAFAQQLDMHVKVAQNHPELFEPFPPELVGGRRRIELGKGTGPFVITWKLRTLGFPELEAEQIGELAMWVNDKAERDKCVVSDQHLLAELTRRGIGT